MKTNFPCDIYGIKSIYFLILYLDFSLLLIYFTYLFLLIIICALPQFPALSATYMRLVALVTEVYAEKVCSLPQSLLHNLLQSVELMLFSYPSHHQLPPPPAPPPDPPPPDPPTRPLPTRPPPLQTPPPPWPRGQRCSSVVGVWRATRKLISYPATTNI